MNGDWGLIIGDLGVRIWGYLKFIILNSLLKKQKKKIKVKLILKI